MGSWPTSRFEFAELADVTLEVFAEILEVSNVRTNEALVALVKSTLDSRPGNDCLLWARYGMLSR